VEETPDAELFPGMFPPLKAANLALMGSSYDFGCGVLRRS
jgi:hypothetical protein